LTNKGDFRMYRLESSYRWSALRVERLMKKPLPLFIVPG
jgi:hypothetical protein